MFVRVLIVAAIAVSAWALFVRDSGAGGTEGSYRVRPGDTLWSIATQSYAGDPRAGVWKLQQRNDLRGVTIVPGQVIVVPS
jgi:nucleoid-associated protein YgaU